MSKIISLLKAVMSQDMNLFRYKFKKKSSKSKIDSSDVGDDLLSDFAFNVARNFIRVASAFANVISRKPDL